MRCPSSLSWGLNFREFVLCTGQVTPGSPGVRDASLWGLEEWGRWQDLLSRSLLVARVPANPAWRWHRLKHLSQVMGVIARAQRESRDHGHQEVRVSAKQHMSFQKPEEIRSRGSFAPSFLLLSKFWTSSCLSLSCPTALLDWKVSSLCFIA